MSVGEPSQPAVSHSPGLEMPEPSSKKQRLSTDAG